MVFNLLDETINNINISVRHLVLAFSDLRQAATT